MKHTNLIPIVVWDLEFLDGSKRRELEKDTWFTVYELRDALIDKHNLEVADDIFISEFPSVSEWANILLAVQWLANSWYKRLIKWSKFNIWIKK